MVVRPVVRIDVAPLVDLRRVRVERLADVEERRPLLVVDLDRVDRRLARPPRLGGDDGDRLALVAHLALGEQRLVGRDAERLEVAVDVLRDVRVRDDRVDARHRLGLAGVERVIAAWWCGERSAFAQSVRPTRTSSTYCVRPVTWPTPS